MKFSARRGIWNSQNMATKFDVTSSHCTQLNGELVRLLGRPCKVGDRVILKESGVEYTLRCCRVKRGPGSSTSFVGEPPAKLVPAIAGPLDVLVEVVSVIPTNE